MSFQFSPMAILLITPVSTLRRNVELVSIPVPYRKPGNVVEHLTIQFEVSYQENNFRAVPFCNTNNKRLTALPDVLLFRVEKGNVVCKRSDLVTVAQKIMSELPLPDNKS